MMSASAMQDGHDHTKTAQMIVIKTLSKMHRLTLQS